MGSKFRRLWRASRCCKELALQYTDLPSVYIQRKLSASYHKHKETHLDYVLYIDCHTTKQVAAYETHMLWPFWWLPCFHWAFQEKYIKNMQFRLHLFLGLELILLLNIKEKLGQTNLALFKRNGSTRAAWLQPSLAALRSGFPYTSVCTSKVPCPTPVLGTICLCLNQMWTSFQTELPERVLKLYLPILLKCLTASWS